MLSINAGSTLDITNNHFIINYGSGPDPIATILRVFGQRLQRRSLERNGH